MTTYPAKRSPNRCPTHPGVLLAEAIEATGLSKKEFAQRLDVTRGHLHDVLAERKPVSTRLAVRLGKLFGNGPEIWANMQTAYDLWQAARDPALAKVRELETA